MGTLGNLRLVGVADVLTMANGLCGILAIYLFAIQGSDITFGSALILLGFVFDGVDGWAARRFGTKHDFGRVLDSVSDAITFCAAPAAMAYVTFTGALDVVEGASPMASWAFDGFVIGTSLSMVALGWTRLWRFTVEGYRHPHFLGLATPAMAFLAIMVCHILNPVFDVNQVLWAPVTGVTVLFVASLLMVAPVAYPRVRGRTAVAFAVLVVAGLATIGVLRWLDVGWTFTLYRAVSALSLALVAGYILLGPAYMSMTSRVQ
jgi:CDP-diacylglycerol--serine O-phosphatidyltransferase